MSLFADLLKSQMTVHYEPAVAVDLEPLLQATLQPPLRPGDVVMLRDYVDDNEYTAFKKGQQFIVTQAFPVIHEAENLGSAAAGKPRDIAIAVRATSTCKCDDPKCENKNRDEILEFLADSREFVKVGRVAGMPD